MHDQPRDGGHQFVSSFQRESGFYVHKELLKLSLFQIYTKPHTMNILYFVSICINNARITMKTGRKSQFCCVMCIFPLETTKRISVYVVVLHSVRIVVFCNTIVLY